jgi:hypothetical protein
MGRKRQANVKRTTSGRKSRAQDAYQEHLEAIATRMRVFGLTEQDARDQKAATYVGRLYLTGQLGKKPYSDYMWDAAQSYLTAYEHFQRAVKSPDALRTGVGGGDEGESETYARWCVAAVRKWEGITVAVREEQNLHRGANIYAALDYLVLRNQEFPHMVGDMRIGLNAVAHYLGILTRRAAA